MDPLILDAIQDNLQSPFLDTLMPFITFLGDIAIVWIVAAVVLIAQPKRRIYGISVIVAIVVAVALGSLVLKPMFGRIRPFEAVEFWGLLITAPRGASFPSNHALVSFAAATVLCCVPDKGRVATLLKVSAVVLACLIAFSRLYLYVHYPTDVVIGAVLGIIVGVASVALVKRVWKEPSASQIKRD